MGLGPGSKLPRIVEAGGVVEFPNPSGQFPNTTWSFRIQPSQFPNTASPPPISTKPGGTRLNVSYIFNVFFGGEGGSKKCSFHLDRSPPFLGFEDPLQETSETRFGGGGKKW